MENLESIEKSDIELNLDKVAKDYAEKLRSEISELKEKEADPHFKNIDPGELTFDDLMIYDKAKKWQLSEHEFLNYSEGLRQYFKEQRESEKKKKADELREKFKNKEIAEEEFNLEFIKLLQQEDEGRKKEGKDYISISRFNSRSNFAAMIKNKLMAEKDIEKHFDNPMFR